MRHTQLIALAMLLAPASLMAGFSIDDVWVNEGDSGIAQLVFTVTLDACLVSFCSVMVDTLDGTAVAGSDYLTTVMPIASLPSPVPQQWQFGVPVLPDTTVELSETLFAILTNPIGATIDDSGGSGEILNDDSAQVWIADPQPRFEDAPTPPASTFSVQLLGKVDVWVFVDFATADGTATLADGDYSRATGTLDFVMGFPDLVREIFFRVVSDNKVELDESFGATLSNLRASGRNVTFLDDAATATILNDDSATLSIDDVVAAEGETGPSIFTFDVSLDREVDVGVDVDFATADGTATVADNDYEASFGTLLFSGSVGEVESINVTVNGDTQAEPDETFFVDLSNIFASSRDVTFADDQGRGTILTEEVTIFADGFESGDTSAWSSTQ